MRNINGMIFLGSGEYSVARVKHLKSILDKAISELSGLQQAGGPDPMFDEEIKECEQNIEDYVRDIAAALTGKEIEFTNGLEYPPTLPTSETIQNFMNENKKVK